MKKIRIYLDTSVISFLLADDAPEKQAVTKQFFDEFVKPAVYDVYISGIVFDEISETRNVEKRERLRGLIDEYELAVFDMGTDSEAISRLAEAYLEAGIIPHKKADDAMHIAIATVKEVDVLLSWNFKHLANIDKERLVLIINVREGYFKPLRMLAPWEVIYERDQ